MAIDLTGVSNENEFYTHHYLAVILENDLKSVFAEWAEQDEPPYNRLRMLARPFQQLPRGALDLRRRAGGIAKIAGRVCRRDYYRSALRC